jgi:hypothetical protein
VIRYVIDASAAVEYLLRTPLGRKLADLIADAFILAPELLDVEVLSVLRRAARCVSTHRGWPSDTRPCSRHCRSEHSDGIVRVPPTVFHNVGFRSTAVSL